MIKLEDFEFRNILLDEKSYENILIYELLYKTLFGAKPLHIMLDKVNGFIRDYDGAKYLISFCLEKYDSINDRIRYLIGLKIGVKDVFSYNFGKLKIDSDDDLPLEETLTLHNAIIPIKLVFNKDQNHYYCIIFLQKMFASIS